MSAAKSVWKVLVEGVFEVARGWGQAGHFSGRTHRRAFWMFAGPHALLLFAGIVADSYFFGLTQKGPVLDWLLFYLAFASLPLLAATVRRIHDTGRSAWNLAWLLVPGIGALLWLILMIEEDHHADNAYGPDPLASSAGTGFFSEKAYPDAIFGVSDARVLSETPRTQTKK